MAILREFDKKKGKKVGARIFQHDSWKIEITLSKTAENKGLHHTTVLRVSHSQHRALRSLFLNVPYLASILYNSIPSSILSYIPSFPYLQYCLFIFPTFHTLFQYSMIQYSLIFETSILSSYILNVPNFPLILSDSILSLILSFLYIKCPIRCFSTLWFNTVFNTLFLII